MRAHFDTHVGRRVLMTLTRSNGEAVPFGAMVSDVDSTAGPISIVGDRGQVYLSGLTDSGLLMAKWGAKENEHCRIAYTLPEATPTSGVVESNMLCQ